MKKVALVHDYLYTYGGAERVLEVLHDTFPNAPVFTTYFLPDKFPESFQKWDIKESFLGKTNFKNTRLRKFFTLFTPIAVERMNLKEFDLIISDSSGPAKGVNKNKNTAHIAYIHTPPWFEWGIIRANWRRRLYLPYLKWFDKRFAKKPDLMIANSRNTQKRIKDFYKRESIVIHPPVEVKKLQSFIEPHTKKEDYYVMVARLDLYKGASKVALILDKYGYKLKVIGSGDDAKNLKHIKSVEHLGFLDDEKKSTVIAKAKALIVWNEEDFGINMAESLACGTPVIAFNKGGALEIVEDGKTGIFFKGQNEKSLIDAVKKVENTEWDYEKIKRSADRFSREMFQKKILDVIEEFTRQSWR